MVTMRIGINASGPLFKDAPAVLEKHINIAVQALVEAGEQHLDEMLKPRPAGVYLSISQARKGQYSQGNYRRGVHGRPYGHRGVIDDSQSVYGPWLEGISPRNVTTRFKGYHSFRQTGQWLEKEAPRIIVAQVDRLVRDLNGA